MTFKIDLPTELQCLKKGTAWLCKGTLPDVSCNTAKATENEKQDLATPVSSGNETKKESTQTTSLASNKTPPAPKESPTPSLPEQPAPPISKHSQSQGGKNSIYKGEKQIADSSSTKPERPSLSSLTRPNTGEGCDKGDTASLDQTNDSGTSSIDKKYAPGDERRLPSHVGFPPTTSTQGENLDEKNCDCDDHKSDSKGNKTPPQESSKDLPIGSNLMEGGGKGSLQPDIEQQNTSLGTTGSMDADQGSDYIKQDKSSLSSHPEDVANESPASTGGKQSQVMPSTQEDQCSNSKCNKNQESYGDGADTVASHGMTGSSGQSKGMPSINSSMTKRLHNQRLKNRI